MKKLLLLIAFVLTAIHSWAGESGTWGDSNGDNVTNTTDLMAIVQYIVGRPDANIDAQTADVNGDGKVDVSDVVSVVNRIVKGSKTVTVASAPQDTIHYMSAEEEKVISLPIPATSIQPMLEEFMSDKDQPENRVFYLEGGKEYFLNGRLSVCKGFTLQTNPEDIAAGKGRAKVYLYHGSLLSGENYTYVFFYMGHSPYEGEETLTPIAIDRLELKDIDFSVPLARNIGDGSAVPGIYAFSQYSNGSGFVAENLHIQNCSFQGLTSGFFRMQSTKVSRIKNFTIDNVDIYNGGYFNTSGRRYNFFNANPEVNANNNIWENFIMKNSTIYDCPLGYMFNHNAQRSVEWADDQHYNITLENNTFINLNTCYVGNSMIFNTRWIPGGSSYTVKRNLFILTRNEDDISRDMVQAGCDIRTINGSGTVTLDFEDNYSTNDNLTEGQIWSKTASAFDYSVKNTFGAMSKSYNVTWGTAGAEGLTVKVADISAKDLMVQPNPPHKFDPANVSHWDHQCDGIDGSVTNPDATIRSDYQPGMVDLHFKNFNNVLVEKQIGAPKWRRQ